ncbi:MAG: PA14 domain-containing protein, partial [Phycisphaerae bacterium]|nr:PA14 domain-containing protein [Phycisphaerae bacterium]
KFLDASGHNLHGLITGSMTTTAGRVGQAAQFDGRSYIEIPEHRLLENLSRQFSISLWFQCDKFTRDFQTLVARGDRTWRVQRDAKHPHLSFDLTGITSPQSDRWGNARLVGKTNVQDGQWHHLVTVYSGQKAQIYVDGRLEAEMPASGAVPFDAQPLRIGSNSQVGNREFLGLIDEVRLYDEAISLEQVLELLKQGGGKVPVPTVVVKPPTTPNGDPVKLAETGRILVERWDRVGGNGNIDHVFRHIGANPTPAVTDYYTQLESPTGQGNNFGRRIKGWLHPPATGPYTFRVEADDRGDLYLSTDHDPSNKRRIARTNQNSQPIQLETGRAYYVEAYHAQDVGPAFVRVKWTRPDRVNEVIPGSALSVAYREIPDHEKGFEVLRPAQLASAKGTKLTVQDDGSIMDVGDAKSIKQGDTFTVTLHPRFTGITALRIETLPDRVFGGAAGRGPGGIFAVSELQATWAPKKTPSAALPLKFIRSTCEGDEAKYEIAQALDGNPATVWAARKAMGKARTATLVLKEPIAGTEEGVLTVTLVNKFNLGRFRISASTATDISRILEEERRPDPLALDEALIAHWTFDKDAGLTANALKFTPHFKGRVNKSRGQIDGALKFDQNTHIDVDGGQRLNLGRQDFTLAAWIKTREGGTILAKTPTGKWASQGKAFFVGQGKLKFDLGHVGVVAGKSTVGDDQWHHVALTYELKTKHLRLYVDGKEDGGNRMPQMNADPADHVLRIGYTTTDFPKEPTSHLKGLLDDLRIYKRTLSAEEMSALAGSAGPAVAVTPPVTPAGTEDELEKPGRIANLIYNQQRVNGDLNRLIALVEKGEKPNQEATCTSFNDGSTNNKKAGQVIRGYLHPPVTGDYTFILQVDDTGRLSVSSDHTQENAKIVARREGGNPPPEATSIHMEAGQVYFVQALGVNTGGGGFLRVLWKRPDGKQEIIPGQYLSIAHRKIPDHEQGFEVLQPTQVASVKGTKLTVQDDGSIMDAGDAKSLRQSDTFTIQLQPEFDGITAFRLETVPDPAFRGGAGRGPGGMFAVAEIQATWAAKAKPDAATPLRFKMAISGTEEPGYQAIRAVDGNPATLWAVRKTVGHPHRATLILEEPIGKAKDSVVTFTIINKFNLGRFRIAASTIPEAKRLTEMALADGKDPPAAGGADPSVPDGPYSKNINLGGGRQRVGRILWVDSPKYKEGETDFGHVGGGKVEFKEGIKDVLAQSAINQIKGYRLKVPNGKYSIRMLFAEHWTNHAGERIFDVAVEGKTVARDFDLIKAARGKHRSLWAPPITSEVKDNLLEIDFKPTKNHALLSALRVERIGGLRPPK